MIDGIFRVSANKILTQSVISERVLSTDLKKFNSFKRIQLRRWRGRVPQEALDPRSICMHI